MSDVIENKIQKSGLVTLDLEAIKPSWLIGGFDMSDCLEEGLVLREKPFREFVKTHDWSRFGGEHVYIHCSTDAIVPTWAYMLIATALEPHAKSVWFTSEQALKEQLWTRLALELNTEDYQDKRVVIKGCGDGSIPTSVYLILTQRLKPVVKSLMFGEPCATVPLYKR